MLQAATWRFISVRMLAVHVLVLEACRRVTHQRAQGLQSLSSSFVLAPRGPLTVCSKCEYGVARTRSRPAGADNAF